MAVAALALAVSQRGPLAAGRAGAGTRAGTGTGTGRHR
jgi:hypothetical protein